MHEEERRLILNMVASGKISVAESLRLLDALEEPEAQAAPVETGELPEEGRDPAGAWDEPAGPSPLEASQVELASVEAGAAFSTETGHESEPGRPPVDGTAAFKQAALEPADIEPAQDAPEGAGPIPLEGEPAGRRRDVSLPRSAARMRQLWQIPLWIGVGIMTVGALLMSAAVQGSGIGFWFLCASVPFLLGLGVLLLGWEARLSPWFHLRVQQSAGEWPATIALSFPLPVRLATWALRTFGSWIPLPGDLTAGDLILALEGGVSPENPIYIEVDDGGDHVQVFIG